MGRLSSLLLLISLVMVSVGIYPPPVAPGRTSPLTPSSWTEDRIAVGWPLWDHQRLLGFLGGLKHPEDMSRSWRIDWPSRLGGDLTITRSATSTVQARPTAGQQSKRSSVALWGGRVWICGSQLTDVIGEVCDGSRRRYRRTVGSRHYHNGTSGGVRW